MQGIGNLPIATETTHRTFIDVSKRRPWRMVVIVAAIGILIGPGSIFAADDGPIAAILQEKKLIADDAAQDDEFGVSVSASGDVALVGAVDDDNDRGSAYIFVRDSSGEWTQQAKLTASDGEAGDNLGLSVFLSGDTALVGAWLDYDTVNLQGSAYIFVKPAGGWQDMNETAKLTASTPGYGDYFGCSVSLSGDTALIGAKETGVSYAAGEAYVFVKPTTGWQDMNETAKLTPSDGEALDSFGASVSLHGDTALIGAPRHETNAEEDSGAAYLFEKPAAGWQDSTETAKLTADEPEARHAFGMSVSLSGDTALVGARGYDSFRGAVYIFVKPAGGWQDMTETARLTASDGQASDEFGWFVSLSDDRALVGAPDVADHRGAAYLFEKPAEGWHDMFETHTIVADDGAADDWFGYKISLSGDTLLIGAFKDSHSGVLDAGAAYVFVFDTDGDGVADREDNCPVDPNADQADDDGDGQGNVCDVCPLDPDDDTDGDGSCGDVDNCPLVPNTDQTDSDDDGIGDACDSCPLDPGNDVDGDDHCGDVDNCPLIPNADQTDSDDDGMGDACDSCPLDPDNDVDADGHCGDVDNCPIVPNADQLESDGDGLGDACDSCPLDPDNDVDADGHCGNVDNCPLVANPGQEDNEGDGLGDVCDPDDDNDLVLDLDDPFPMSNMDPTVIIDGCDSGVTNLNIGGASFSDHIGVCAETASNHGQFVSCVTALATDWLQAGLITGRDLARLVNAADGVNCRR